MSVGMSFIFVGFEVSLSTYHRIIADTTDKNPRTVFSCRADRFMVFLAHACNPAFLGAALLTGPLPVHPYRSLEDFAAADAYLFIGL